MKAKIVSQMTTLFSTSKNKTRKIRHKRIKFNYINEKKRKTSAVYLSIDRSSRSRTKQRFMKGKM